MARVEPVDRFAANVRHRRLELGMSQEALGFACDVHRTEISLLERGGREPRLGTIVRLAHGLGVTPADLLAGVR